MQNKVFAQLYLIVRQEREGHIEALKRFPGDHQSSRGTRVRGLCQ